MKVVLGSLTVFAITLTALFIGYVSPSHPTSKHTDSLPPTEADINTLLKEEVKKKLPTDRTTYVREYPILQPWHRMTDYLTLHLEVPSIHTEDPEEALRLSLPYFQAYVDSMNNVREARPYLMNFPINLLMMDFTIGFAKDKKTGLPLYEPCIASLLFCGRDLEITRFYRKITYPNGRTCTNSYDNIYDQSKGLPPEIKQAEIPRFDAEKPKKPISIPSVVEYRYLNDSGKNEFEYLQAFGKKNELIFLAFESAFPYPIERSVFAEVAYATQEKRISLEEAKALALRIQKGLAEFHIKDGRFTRFVNRKRTEGKPTFENPVNVQRFMGFRVSFWDQYIDRVAPPAIAEFRVYGTKACYYTADEHQRLQLVCEEEFAPFELDIPPEAQNDKDTRQSTPTNPSNS
jgi:hypothetical protein